MLEFAESAVLANDLKEEGFTVVALDTGWVRTEMGNTTEQHTNGSAPLDVLTSVAGKTFLPYPAQHVYTWKL